jgi:hypothetical protein
MRRVVTGPAEGGGAAIVLDGEPPTVVEFGQYRTTELWVADGPATAADTSTRPWELEPPPGGSCEVTLTIGGTEVTLGPGDTVVQQGTPHDWRNRGTEPCVMAGVLISTR